MNSMLLAALAALAAALAVYDLATAFLIHQGVLKRLAMPDPFRLKVASNRIRRFLIQLDQSNWGKRVAKQLARADLSFRPCTFGALQLAAGLLLIGTLMKGGLDLWWAITIGPSTIRWSVGLWLRTRSGRIAAAVERQLPRVTRLLANSLRAGMSLRQGFDAVASDLRPPAGPAFWRLQEELQLNLPVERALDRLVDRVPSKELQLMADVILIHHRAGGDLVAALEEMTATLTERHALNQEVRTATAQQRFVAWTLPVMLVGVMLMMGAMLPGFLRPLATHEGILLVVIPVGGAVAASAYLVHRFASIRW